ncbi:MAG: VVA0879 family protein [Vicinamibacterales bacterium]
MKCEPRRLTRAEYLAEMELAHGAFPPKWRCKCPICGIEYSLAECIEAGGGPADRDARRAIADRGLSGCIGRINGKGGDAFGTRPHNEHGCNFAANGLLRSPWILAAEDGQPETGVMPIAAPLAVAVEGGAA